MRKWSEMMSQTTKESPFTPFIGGHFFGANKKEKRFFLIGKKCFFSQLKKGESFFWRCNQDWAAKISWKYKTSTPGWVLCWDPARLQKEPSTLPLRFGNLVWKIIMIFDFQIHRSNLPSSKLKLHRENGWIGSHCIALDITPEDELKNNESDQCSYTKYNSFHSPLTLKTSQKN